jgi:hypothetical protein
MRLSALKLRLSLLAFGLILGAVIGFLWMLKMFVSRSVPTPSWEAFRLVQLTVMGFGGAIIVGITLLYLQLTGRIENDPSKK